jgi:hypothetical protein
LRPLITGSDDAWAQVATMSSMVAELKRQLTEGGGVPVENGDYKAYAESLKSGGGGCSEDDLAAAAARAEQLGKLSPAEAARVIQAMGDWVESAKMLRGNPIDFISDVLTCDVLDHADVASALSHLGDIDGTVLFSMMRKTTTDNVTGPINAAHPSVGALWLASAAAQAKKRLSLIGDGLGPEAIVDMIGELGDDDDVLVLDSQSPSLLARVFELMHFNNEFGEAVEALERLSGNTRIDTLNAMDDATRAEFLAAMNKEMEGSFTCGKCGYCAGNDDDAAEEDLAVSGEMTAVVFQKPLLEHEIMSDPTARSMAFIRPPQSWMDYCDVSGINKLQKKWEKDDCKLIAPIKLRSMVTGIYISKLKSDVALLREEKHRIPLSEFVVQWFDTNYGLKKLAKKKMVCFIFSLQKIYEEGKDMRVCQFVRLSGMYHPLPNVLCDLLLECMEIISGTLSGSGEAFRTDTEFWTTWGSGKMIPINKKKQLSIFTQVFGPKQDAIALFERMSDELSDNPEVVPSYVILPPNSGGAGTLNPKP